MKKLNVAIPTYNRSKILIENLNIMKQCLIDNNIDVFIYDDSDNEITKTEVEFFKNENSIKNIHYFKNSPSLGHDKNCLFSLSNTPGDYIWYLGDSFAITDEGLRDTVRKIQENNFDAIVYSVKSRVKNKNSTLYNNYNQFYTDLSWHATMTSCTIYKKDVIKRAIDNGNCQSFIGKNFMQLGILLEGIAFEDTSVMFYNEFPLILNKEKKEAYWRTKPIETFCVDWYNFNMLLTNKYTNEEKKIAIKNHDLYIRLFSPLRVMYMKGLGYITYGNYKENENMCIASISSNKVLLKLILCIPNVFLAIPSKILKKFT